MTNPKCFAVLILMFSCCITQEPDEKRCVGGSELSFFIQPSLRKVKSEAIKACRNYQNSSLVKVDSSDITAAINSVIRVNENTSYIGGQPTTRRNWIWPDGTKIYLPDENDGYQNWSPGQPNNFEERENCIIVGRRTTQWLDASCYERLGYICQKDVDLCIAVSSILNTHKCIATGSSSPRVVWRKGNTLPVNTSATQTIYQTKVSEGSILHFENASIGDAGNYTCAAWVGVNGNTSFSEPVMINVFVIPTEQAEQLTEITGLQPETEYNIKLTACQNMEGCSDENTVRDLATTHKRGKVTSAFLIQLNENSCNVTWNWPYVITENKSVKFEIILNTEKHYVNVSQRPFYYSFEPLQSSYKVKVQSLEIVKLCGYVEAVGTCTKKDDLETAHLLAIIIPVTVAPLIILVIVVILKKRKKNDVTETSGTPAHSDINVVNQITDSVEYYNVRVGNEVSDVGTSGVAQTNVEVVYQNCAQYDTAASVYLN